MNQRHFDLIDMLIKFNTESPPARNTDPLQDDIEDLLKELNFEIERIQQYENEDLRKERNFEIERIPLYENDSVINAVLRGTDKDAPKLILNGHVDVAEVGDTSEWLHPPFQLTKADEYLYGRGVSDMKGG